jgi:HIV Tat-specific factor 1
VLYSINVYLVFKTFMFYKNKYSSNMTFFPFSRYDPKLKPKKLKKKELARLKRIDKMLAWEPDQLRGERPKRDKVVVVKNLFEPKCFEETPELILECSSRLRQTCEKFGGVRKVVVYDQNEEGVAQVFFSSAAEADQAVAMMDGRLFFLGRLPGRTMTAATWDGKTKFKKNETEEEEQKRLAQWDKWLEEQDNEKEKASDKPKDNVTGEKTERNK